MGEMVKVFPKGALQQNIGEAESTTTITEGPETESTEEEYNTYTCTKCHKIFYFVKLK